MSFIYVGIVFATSLGAAVVRACCDACQFCLLPQPYSICMERIITIILIYYKTTFVRMHL